jgi:RHS repeat-associated protein
VQLGNHLGNVLTTITDRKFGVSSNGTTVDYFEPDMLSGTDYYAFGSAMRVAGEGAYRFGFNGKEMSNEIKGGVGNNYTAEFWEYDPRIGRRWNLDPRPMVGVSEYSAFNNNPILHSDPLGDTTSRPSWAEKGPINLSKYKAGSLPYKGSILNKADAAVNNWVLAPIGNLVIDAIDAIGNPATSIYDIGQGIGNGYKALGEWSSNNPDLLGGVMSGLGSGYNYAKENYNNPDAHLQVASQFWGLFGGSALAPKINIASRSSISFYTVQGEADAARLLSGGHPWPSSPTRAHLGEGVYSWGNLADAQNYLSIQTKFNPDVKLSVLKFSMKSSQFTKLRSFQIPLDDAAANAWLGKHSRLYGTGTPHNYQYIQGNTNIGTEHYFSSEIFPLLKFKKK